MNTATSAAPGAPTRDLEGMRAHIQSGIRRQKIFALTGILFTSFAVLVLLAAFLDLLFDGLPRLSWDFMTSFPSRHASKAGILSSWVGSALVMLVTMVAAVPVAIGAAIYLEEYAGKNWFTDLIEINVTNLAGVPSIVYGLLALGLFVYQFGFGESILTAGLTLGLLILPVVIVSSREALRAVPIHIREAAYGVGATRWQMVRDHLLPESRRGMLTGGSSSAWPSHRADRTDHARSGAAFGIAVLPRRSGDTASGPFLSLDMDSGRRYRAPCGMHNWGTRPTRLSSQCCGRPVCAAVHARGNGGLASNLR